MSPQYERQRRKQQIFLTAPQMAARINADSSDDKTTRDVALWGETHRLTVILITHGGAGSPRRHEAGAGQLQLGKWSTSRRSGPSGHTILRVNNGSMKDRSNSSRWSLWSRNSVLSIGSRNSVLSVGSIGCVLSIGGVGSAGSILSIGSFLSVASMMSGLSWWSVMAWRSKRSIASSGANC